MQQKESVEVPVEYLISVHKMLNQSYEKMKEALGESVALMFFAMASEYDPLPDLPYTDIDAVDKGLDSMLKTYGYSLTATKRGDKVEYRLRCPHAATIHPEMGSGATFCPMSQLALGAIRRRHKRSVLTESRLEKDGSSFMVEVQD
ncbi:MAG: hypothetical protein JRM80_13260 [Nitrososphaerota archaeon]|nr:hypothetical protein [Nitrososphaerota archaeon]